MSNKTTINHASFAIERHYPCSLAKAFDAFADPVKKRRWFAEGEGFHVDSFEMDFRVGGFERARFRFMADKPIEEGTPCNNDSLYMDIVPNKRIVLAYTMTVGGQRISASLTTTEFFEDGDGTRLVFTEQAAFFEGGDGLDMRKQGWNQLLEQLAKELDA